MRGLKYLLLSLWMFYSPWEAPWQWKENALCGISNAGQEFTAGSPSLEFEGEKREVHQIELVLGTVKLEPVLLKVMSVQVKQHAELQMES